MAELFDVYKLVSEYWDKKIDSMLETSAADYIVHFDYTNSLSNATTYILNNVLSDSVDDSASDDDNDDDNSQVNL